MRNSGKFSARMCLTEQLINSVEVWIQNLFLESLWVFPSKPKRMFVWVNCLFFLFLFFNENEKIQSYFFSWNEKILFSLSLSPPLSFFIFFFLKGGGPPPSYLYRTCIMGKAMPFWLNAGTVRDGKWPNKFTPSSSPSCLLCRQMWRIVLSSGSVYSPVPHRPLLNPAVRRQRLPPSCDCLSRLPSWSLEYFTNIDRDTFRKRCPLPYAFSGGELKLRHCQRCPQMSSALLEANLASIWRNYICWKSNITWIYSPSAL